MRKVYGLQKIEMLKDYIGLDLYNRLNSSRSICQDLDKAACFIMFDFTDIRGGQLRDEQVCIYCGENELIFISDNKRCLEVLSSVSQENQSYNQLLDFFMQLTAGDLDILEALEDKIIELEDLLISTKRPDNKNRASIITLRRGLLRMKRYYEQLKFITDRLSENLNEALPAELIKHYVSLNRRVNHLLDSVLHLREYITQVREAYQAQIDIEQNQIMKVFTVLTAIFLPLTLIVGWYGMNFSMPELAWPFGYPYVIILSAAVCLLCIVFFKAKKWF